MPNFPLVEGMGGRDAGRDTYPSLDLGWMGIWIYKIPGYTQSIKLILRVMPMSVISCQVVIWAGRCSNTGFWKLCFHFSLLDSALHLFLSFYKWAKPEQNEDVLQNILKSKALVGKTEGAQQESQLRLPCVQSKALFPSAQHSEFHTGGHNFPLNSQLMSPRVATLMLFRQFSSSTQTVNWSV